MRILDTIYNKQELSGALKATTSMFVRQHEALCEEQGIDKFQIDLAYAKTLNKALLTTLISIPFKNKILFEAYKEILVDEVRVILDELIWVKELSHQEIQERFDISIYDKSKSRYTYSVPTYRIKPQFGIFARQIHHAYGQAIPEMSLFLPKEVRSYLMQFSEPPKGAAFEPIAKIEPTDYVYQGEQDILSDLPRIVAYRRRGEIKSNNKGVPIASTYGKMQRKLELKEFFPESEEKSLKYLRTGLLASLILAVRHAVVPTDIAGQLKELTCDHFINNFSSGHGIINYLKGMNRARRDRLQDCEVKTLLMFKEMPVGVWLAFSNIVSFVKYRDYRIEPISTSKAGNLYYEYFDDEGHGKYSSKKWVSKERYHRSILVPYLKGVCYLFAAYGLLDIAYDTPNVAIMGKTAQSPYDGLKYIRINKLGAYALEKTSTYESSGTLTKTTIRLSEDSLTVIIDENDMISPLILEPFTERVSPNRFRTEADFFLRGVVSRTQLNHKIDTFKTSVSADIPDNWQRFFQALKGRINPLETVSDIRVFHIPNKNKELIQLIAKDPYLQEICLKAEGYHVIVSHKNLPKFKRRLEEFGYFLN